MTVKTNFKWMEKYITKGDNRKTELKLKPTKRILGRKFDKE